MIVPNIDNCVMSMVVDALTDMITLTPEEAAQYPN